VHDVHVAIPEGLADDARRVAQLPEHTTVQALIRLALAKLANWPEAAAATIARPRAGGK
jgi:hypothetical protein